MIFLVHLTKKWENIWDLSNYVGMNFLAKQTTTEVINSGGGSNYVGMISLVNLTKQKSEKTYGTCQIMLEWIS